MACDDRLTPTPSPVTVAAVATATSAPAATKVATAVPATTVASLPTVTPAPATTVATTAAAATTAAPVATTAAAATTNAPVATIAPSVATAVPPVATAASRIAYVDGYSLFVIDLASKVKKQLVQSGQQGVSGNPAWSPDNKLIVVAIQADIKAKNGRSELYTVNPDNGESKRLFADQPATASDSDPLWSPDGTTITFTRLLGSTGNFDPIKNKHEIWLADANGQNPRKLASGWQPAWSPDSRRVAFVTDGTQRSDGSYPQNNALHLINSKGQNEWEPLTTAKVPTDWTKFNYPFNGEATYLQWPVFLDDGKTVAFTSIGATGLVLTMNSSSGGDLKLWAGQFEGSFGRAYAQPKANTLLLFEGYPPSGFRSLGVVDTSKPAAPDKPILQNFGGNPTKGEALLPAWSPDGTQIAYVNTKTAPTDIAAPVSGSLIVTKIGTSDATELVKGTITGVAWSH